MHYCLECREEAVGPICHRCGANTITGANSTLTGATGSSADRAAALCYVLWFVSALVMLAIPRFRHSRTVKFHAYQSILLSALLMVVFFSLGLYLPLRLRDTVFWAFQVAALTLWVSMIALTWMGKNPSVPWVGGLAEKQM
ncbi:MAG: hypothetical protein R2762_11800 [Bryobacteraceae bacterium]